MMGEWGIIDNGRKWYTKALVDVVYKGGKWYTKALVDMIMSIMARSGIQWGIIDNGEIARMVVFRMSRIVMVVYASLPPFLL
jgi:hypothetical protein